MYEFDTISDLLEAIELLNAKFKFFDSLLSIGNIDDVKDFISDMKAFIGYKGKTLIDSFTVIFELNPEKFRYLRFVYGVVIKRKEFFEELFMEFFKRSKDEYLKQMDSIDTDLKTLRPIDDDSDLKLGDLTPVTIAHKFFFLVGEPDEYFRHLLNVKLNSYVEWLKVLDKISTAFKYLNMRSNIQNQPEYEYFLVHNLTIEKDEYEIVASIRINVSFSDC